MRTISPTVVLRPLCPISAFTCTRTGFWLSHRPPSEFGERSFRPGTKIEAYNPLRHGIEQTYRVHRRGQRRVRISTFVYSNIWFVYTRARSSFRAREREREKERGRESYFYLLLCVSLCGAIGVGSSSFVVKPLLYIGVRSALLIRCIRMFRPLGYAG